MQKLITPDELAALLAIKKSTVYQWTHTGFVPHIKLGRFVRFRLLDIENWLEKHNTKGRASLSMRYKR